MEATYSDGGLVRDHVEAGEAVEDLKGAKGVLKGYTLKGNPVREGAPLCGFYLKNKYCGKKAQCPFTHPGAVATQTPPPGPDPNRKPRVKAEPGAKSGTSPAHMSPEEQAAELRMIADLESWLQSHHGQASSSILREFLLDFPEHVLALAGHSYSVLSKYPERLQVVAATPYAKFYRIALPGVTVIQSGVRHSHETLTQEGETDASLAISASSKAPPMTPSKIKPSPASDGDDLLAARMLAFVESMPGKRIGVQDLGKFYLKYPEYRDTLRGRAPAFFARFSDMFYVAYKNGHISGIFPASKNPEARERNASISSSTNGISTAGEISPEAKKQNVSPAKKAPTPVKGLGADRIKVDVDETVANLLVDFISHQPGKFIRGTDMGKFMLLHPEHRSAIKGNLKNLCDKFPDRLHIAVLTKTVCVASVKGSDFWGQDLEQTRALLGLESSSEPNKINNKSRTPPPVTSSIVAGPPPPARVSASAGTIGDIHVISGTSVLASQSSNAVKQELASWVPFREVCVDLDGNSHDGRVTNVKMFRCDGERAAVLASMLDINAALMRSGIPEVLEDAGVVKACLSVSEVAAGMYRQTGAVLRGPFDLRIAAGLLIPGFEAWKEASLLSLAERFEVDIPEGVSALVDECPTNFKFQEFAQWCAVTGRLLTALYRKLRLRCTQLNVLNACLEASQLEALRGIICIKQCHGDFPRTGPLKRAAPGGIVSARNAVSTKPNTRTTVPGGTVDKRSFIRCWRGPSCSTKDCPFKHDAFVRAPSETPVE